MGKSWRRRDHLVPCQQTDYKWSSQSYTLKEIQTNFKLPVVVQCREDTVAQQLKDFFFDLRQPLLLHSKRSIRKIFARCIRMGPGGTVKELLPEVVIPEDYAGWFKISKGLSFTKPVPHHNIEELSKCPAEFFLCTTEFHALLLSPDSDSDASDAGHSRIIAEGEVLRKAEIHTINHTLIPARFKKLAKEGKFLLCIDESDTEIYIPVGQKGLFYEVSDGNLSKSNNCVLQILDILDEMIELPIYVRHILGDPPPVSQFYSPCLKLHRMLEEETIMGCTLDREDLLPFEIQTNSPITFEISLNTQKLQGTVDYVEAIGLCKSIGQNYVTDMKLAVTFCHLDSEVSTPRGHDNEALQAEDNQCSNDTSQRTSLSVENDGQSETCEVDAQSEFSIQWDPGPRSPTNTEIDSHIHSEKESDCESIESFQSEDGRAGNPTEEQLRVQTRNAKNWFQFANQNPDSDDGAILDVALANGHMSDIPPIKNPVWAWEESAYNEIHKYAVRPITGNKKNDLSTSTPSYYDADSEPSSLSNITIESTSFRVQSADDQIYNSNDHFDLQINGDGHYSFTGDVYVNFDSDDDNVSVSDISTCSGPSRSSSSERTLILTPSSSQSQEIGTLKEEPKLNPWLELERQRKKTIAELQEFKASQGMKDEQDAEIEKVWSEFCTERTLSLPRKAKSRKIYAGHIKEHSNSWEQVSPRGKTKLLDMSVVSAGLDVWTPRTIRRYNSDCTHYGDQTHLISDTSSEDSIPVMQPNRSKERIRSTAHTSEGNHNLYLSGVNEVKYERNDHHIDETKKTIEDQNKSDIIAQILRLKNEMKKNTFSDWNEISEII